jgi:hypothetical protein
MKYGVYTRSFFENEYLDLGFDKIIILHTDGTIYNLPDKFSNVVEIYYIKNNGDHVPNYVYFINQLNKKIISDATFIK